MVLRDWNYVCAIVHICGRFIAVEQGEAELILFGLFEALKEYGMELVLETKNVNNIFSQAKRFSCAQGYFVWGKSGGVRFDYGEIRFREIYLALHSFDHGYGIHGRVVFEQ